MKPTPRRSCANALRAIRGALTSTADARVAVHHHALERQALTRAMLALAEALRHAKTALRLKQRRGVRRAAA